MDERTSIRSALRMTASAVVLTLAGTNLAFANGLQGGTLRANCDGFRVTADARFLNPNIDNYTADYTVTISGCVPAPIDVTGRFPLVKNADPTTASGAESG